MDKSRVEPTIFFIEKISFSLKLFSGHFYGQSFIKTVRGPLSSWCLVMVEQLFLAVPWGCLRFVIVVFPDHTHLLFLCQYAVCIIPNTTLKK